MNSTDKTRTPAVDDVADALRHEPIDAAAEEAAIARAWETISRARVAPVADAPVPEHFRSCDDFRAAMPALVAGTLDAPKAMLVEDHVRGCVPCRKELFALRSGVRSAPRPAAADAGRRSPFARPALWAAAAMVVVAVGAGALLLGGGLFAPAGVVATVESVDGLLLRFEDGTVRSVGRGESLDAKDAVRTAKGASAMLRLADGSLVEMNERTELSVVARRGGTTLALARGNVLVQAAKQSSGKHLRVATRDCVVSVVGTVFAVNAGTKGARVSVLEGKVEVDDGRATAALLPGDQVTTGDSVERVPLDRDVAWSRDAAKWIALSRELHDLQKEAARTLAADDRTASELLAFAPAGTAVWVAAPNLSSNLSDFWQVVRERVASQPALAEWWGANAGSPEAQAKIDDLLVRIRALGAGLGDEVALSFRPGSSAGRPEILACAKIVDRTAFLASLDEEIARIAAENEGKILVVRVDDPSAVPASERDRQVLWVWAGADLFGASPSLDSLAALAAAAADPASNPFASSPFAQRIAEAHAGGVEWIAAVDLATVLAKAADAAASEGNGNVVDLWQQLGILDADTLVVTARRDGERFHDSAELTFRDTRHGLAAWLAAPAPMGSLDFVSPEASLAASFVIRDPALLVDDLLGAFEAVDPEVRAKLAELEAREGLSLRDDLAAPIGGEATFALDGPVLPTPAWKLVVEVYDEIRLQRTLEALIAKLDDRLRVAGHAGLRLDVEVVGGRTFYAVRSLASGVAVHYAYVDAFLVVTPDRALIDRAIDVRSSGATLARSEKFAALMPADGRVNFSAVAWQNLGDLVGSVAAKIAGAASNGKVAPSTSIASSASLAWAYGEEKRVVFAATGEGGLFGFDLASLLTAARAAQPPSAPSAH